MTGQQCFCGCGRSTAFGRSRELSVAAARLSEALAGGGPLGGDDAADAGLASRPSADSASAGVEASSDVGASAGSRGVAAGASALRARALLAEARAVLHGERPCPPELPAAVAAAAAAAE